MNVKILPVAVLLLPMSSRGDGLSAGIGPGSGPGGLPFRRIVDIPFETCVAALEGWRRDGDHSELQLGRSTLRGPVGHDRGSGTCRVEVRLARGPLRPPWRMRLNLDRRSTIFCTRRRIGLNRAAAARVAPATADAGL